MIEMIVLYERVEQDWVLCLLRTKFIILLMHNFSVPSKMFGNDTDEYNQVLNEV